MFVGISVVLWRSPLDSWEVGGSTPSQGAIHTRASSQVSTGVGAEPTQRRGSSPLPAPHTRAGSSAVERERSSDRFGRWFNPIPAHRAVAQLILNSSSPTYSGMAMPLRGSELQGQGLKRWPRIRGYTSRAERQPRQSAHTRRKHSVQQVGSAYLSWGRWLESIPFEHTHTARGLSGLLHTGKQPRVVQLGSTFRLRPGKVAGSIPATRAIQV